MHIDEGLIPQTDLITMRDLVVLDSELVAYFRRIHQDPHTDPRTRFLAAVKLAEIAKECRRAWELTEVERRLERLEALQEAGQASQTAMYRTLEQLVDLYDRLTQRLNSGDAQEGEG